MFDDKRATAVERDTSKNANLFYLPRKERLKLVDYRKSYGATCITCNGEKTCGYCRNDPGKCGKCDGEGEFTHSCDCKYCTRGDDECSYCDGSGDCEKCSGSGECNECNGKGIYQ